MFSMIPLSLHIPKVEHELASFKEDYLDHPEGAFIVACQEGDVVGTVGYVAYDDRFSHLRQSIEGRGRTVDVRWG